MWTWLHVALHKMCMCALFREAQGLGQDIVCVMMIDVESYMFWVTFRQSLCLINIRIIRWASYSNVWWWVSWQENEASKTLSKVGLCVGRGVICGVRLAHVIEKWSTKGVHPPHYYTLASYLIISQTNYADAVLVREAKLARDTHR